MKRQTRKRQAISDILRDAVVSSGTSLNELASKSGVSVAILSRFVRGERTITLSTADRLAECLALDLVRRQRIGGKIGRGVAKLVLAGTLLAGFHGDHTILQDAYVALLGVGHNQSEARAMLARVIAAGGKQFTSAADVLAAIYRPA